MITIDVTPQETLSSQERSELDQLEAAINLGIRAYHQVGKALATIHAKRLYRERCQTFESYCQERWDLSRPQAYRLIDAAKVIADLSPIGDTLPVNEAQCRPLTQLPTEKRIEAWKEVIATAPSGNITAALVTDVVKTIDLKGNCSKRYHEAEKLVSSFITQSGDDTPRDIEQVFAWAQEKKGLTPRQREVLRDDVKVFLQKPNTPTSQNKSGTSGFSKPSNQTRKPDKSLEIARTVAHLKPEVVITALKKNKVPKEEATALAEAFYQLCLAIDDAFQ